jgi:hypothetical protein
MGRKIARYFNLSQGADKTLGFFGKDGNILICWYLRRKTVKKPGIWRLKQTICQESVCPPPLPSTNNREQVTKQKKKEEKKSLPHSFFSN